MNDTEREDFARKWFDLGAQSQYQSQYKSPPWSHEHDFKTLWDKEQNAMMSDSEPKAKPLPEIRVGDWVELGSHNATYWRVIFSGEKTISIDTKSGAFPHTIETVYSIYRDGKLIWER